MKSVVITTRHPDHGNEHKVFEGDEPGVEIIDVDMGSSFDGKAEDEDQWDEWSSSIMADVSPEYPTEVLHYIESVLAGAHPDA